MASSVTFDSDQTPMVVLSLSDSGVYTAELTVEGAPDAGDIRSVTAEEADSGVLAFSPAKVTATDVDTLITLACYAMQVAVEVAFPEADPGEYVMAHLATARGVRGALRLLDEELV